MFVGQRMTGNPWTVGPQTPLPEAIALMETHKIRHLPVLEEGSLVGVLSHGDVDAAMPSKATSLAAGEVTYLLGKLKVGKVMTKNPVTIGPDALLEQAAVLMRDNRIEMLPVMDGGTLVGVITESALLDAFIEILGFRDHGTRLTIEAPDTPGTLAKLTDITARHGANIQHLAVYRGSAERSDVVVGVNTHNTAELEADIVANGFTILHRLEND